jgi:ribosomal protein S18 acetylase RimI-like enzyme
MEIRFLQDTPLPQIADAFNDAFSDYFIDVHLSPELLAFKIAAEDINLHISPAVFDRGELVGLMLHGDRVEQGIRTAYNAGTGVRPELRRQGLTKRMYAALLPTLRQMGFQRCQLEVIDINAPALEAYLQQGFRKLRKLDVYSGKAPTAALPVGYRFERLSELPDEDMLRSFWDSTPTWQHSFATARNTWDRQMPMGVLFQDTICAYGIVTPFSGRVLQVAVAPAHRGLGIGKALLAHLQVLAEADLRFVNVEQMPNGPGDFLSHLGFRKSLSQWELELTL